MKNCEKCKEIDIQKRLQQFMEGMISLMKSEIRIALLEAFRDHQLVEGKKEKN